MKRFVSIILAAIMLASFAGCTGSQQHANVDPTAAPTEAATAEPTAAPTAVPTEEPTHEPTETPTPEPTATPEPVELDFDECAELVCTLPWGTGDNEVYFEWPNEGEGWAPQHFFVSNGKIYIFDFQGNYEMGFITYDIESGEIGRISITSDIHYIIWTCFAVLDGKLIGQKGVFDLETGEQYLIQPLIQQGDEPMYLRCFQVRDGKCYGYVGKTNLYYDPEMEYLDEYELDLGNRMWIYKRRIISTQNDRGFIIDDAGNSIPRATYLGFDAEGNHYTQGEGEIYLKDENGWVYSWETITKYAPDGHAVSVLKFDFKPELIRTYTAERFSLVTEDGTVWLMIEHKDGLRIYKVNM